MHASYNILNISLCFDFTDSVAADKCSKNSQRDQPSCQLHTPDDATCTHILVFPTSATKQVCCLLSNKNLSTR